MKQVLIYLVEFLKEQHGMSMAEMSKGLGKGRNFIREAITRGYENEDNYGEIIINLKFNFFHSYDSHKFYMFIEEKKHQESIDSYKVALKQSIESNLEEIEKKNKQISDLEHRIVVLSRDIDKGWKEVNKLNEVVATKDLFIDGQDEEIKGLKERVNTLLDKAESEKKLIADLSLELEKTNELIGIESNQVDRQSYTIESLTAISRELGTENTKLQKRNRILLSMLLLFCAIDLIMAFLRYM